MDNPSMMEGYSDLSTQIQLPATLDTTMMNVFPMEELINQDNIDFSTFDDLCVFGDIRHSETQNMENSNFVQGISDPETHTLDVDWLSGNGTSISDVLNEQQSGNFHQSYLDELIYPNNSTDVFQTICLESLKDLNADKPLSDPVYEPLSSASPGSQSNYSFESEQESAVVCNAKSPLTSENEDFLHEDGKAGNVCVAGKKYLQMRKKNNIASQRSRKLRKQKNLQMTERLKELEIERRELLQKAEELEKQRDALQKRLLSIISKR